MYDIFLSDRIEIYDNCVYEIDNFKQYLRKFFYAPLNIALKFGKGDRKASIANLAFYQVSIINFYRSWKNNFLSKDYFFISRRLTFHMPNSIKI